MNASLSPGVIERNMLQSSSSWDELQRTQPITVVLVCVSVANERAVVLASLTNCGLGGVFTAWSDIEGSEQILASRLT